MGASSPTVVGVDLPELMDAISAGDWPRADTLVRAAGRVTGEALQPAALVHLQLGRYREAAKLLSRVIDRDPGLELSRNYARNLAALAEHRPDVLETIEASPADESVYQLAEGAGGRWTIRQRLADGRVTGLSRDDDPVGAMTESLRAVREASAIGKGAALYGLGDGYLLKALAATPPDLPFDARQTVYIVQPDARLLHVALMIHDYAGATGPIADPRFIWLIGEDWTERMLAAMRAEPFLPPPAISVRQTPDAAGIDAGFAEVAEALIDEQNALTEQTERYYAELADDELTAMFSAAPPRRPRVLLLTTRYSTVLKHSTADTAAAFGQLGWDARTIIEPADHLTITALAMKRAIAEHRPDLVVQIDHLRHEHPGMFPAALPFVCWIQDHLANLTSRAAAERLGERDFVMTGAAYRYVRDYGYPAGQCIDIPKLAAVSDVSPTVSERYEEDLVYLSNQSEPAERELAKVIGQLGDSGLDRAVCGVAEAAGQRMIERSARGESFPHFFAVRRVLRETASGVGVDLAGHLEARLVEALFDRIANRLYRHQAIGWAAALAERRGLTLSLHGRGWADHPTLAKHARDPVSPGEPLRQLLSRTRIALQLEPYACFTHPRLLEGLASGGFLLIRDHPFNHQPQRLLNWLTERGCAGETIDEVRGELTGDDRATFDQLIAEQPAIADLSDPVTFARTWHRCGVIEPGRPMPHLNAVTFHDAASFEAAVDRFIDDHDARRAVADDLRRHLLDRLSYVAGMRRLIGEIGRRLGRKEAAR